MMPLPDTLTGKWRCVCPKLDFWAIDCQLPEGEASPYDTTCPLCNEKPIILVRAEQSGSFDDREGHG